MELVAERVLVVESLEIGGRAPGNGECPNAILRRPAANELGGLVIIQGRQLEPTGGSTMEEATEVEYGVRQLVGRECSRITIDRYDPPLVLWFLHDGPMARVEISAPLRFRTGMLEARLDPWGTDPIWHPFFDSSEMSLPRSRLTRATGR
jgi:hypothetical protein